MFQARKSAAKSMFTNDVNGLYYGLKAQAINWLGTYTESKADSKVVVRFKASMALLTKGVFTFNRFSSNFSQWNLDLSLLRFHFQDDLFYCHTLFFVFQHLKR